MRNILLLTTISLFIVSLVLYARARSLETTISNLERTAEISGMVYLQKWCNQPNRKCTEEINLTK